MRSSPRARLRRTVPTRAALALALALAGVAAVTTASRAATMTTLYASPTGTGTACSTTAPCSLTQAKTSVEAIDANMSGDIVVQLAGGTYRLSAPLTLGTADSGSNGYSVIWQAAPGQSPILSGGQQVTGWTLHDSSANIYSAAVPTGADSRQLYVDGALAPRAAITINRSDVKVTTTGLTIQNSALNYLAGLSQQNRIELESQNSFTDRFSPVQSISGSTITMQQPAWNNNNWGYDTIASPFAGGQLLIENSYSFLKNAGQWYLDPQAGQLYYKAPSGWNPASHDVELPRLTSLVHISGSYANPAHNIAFQGVSFQHTTWLTPSTSVGYADQQSGTFLAAQANQPSDFLSSCQSGCRLFEATRNSLYQVPAAVQISAANAITFRSNTFTHLGQVGLGIGNDDNATASGTGLGASNVTAYRNTFTDDSGAGIVVGGVRPDAHHPSNTAMTVQNVTLQDNLISNVAEDYKDMAGILSTYVTHAVITHNEVANLAYDGIDIGWGWGMNDAGGSQDYVNRGTYNYQPIYSTPTTLKNTQVSYNLIHGTKRVFHDGGSLYNLSDNPGSSFDHNYIYDNQRTVGLYLDEGSRHVTLSNNVIQDSGVWAFTNASSTNNTSDNTFSNNWYNGGATQVATGSPHNNVLTGNVQVSGTNWPSGAQQVIAQAGVERPNTVTVANPGNQTGSVGTAASLQIRASDSASGQTFTYSASGLPAGLSINSSTGLISGTPTTAGASNVTVSATDTSGASGSVSFTWGISDSANPVTVTNPGNQTGTVGTAVSLQIHATDSASGATLVYGATGLPAGLSLDSSTGLISGTPTAAATSSVTVTATDTRGASGSASFTWTISGSTGNTVTVTNPGNQTGTVGTAISGVQVQATDSAAGQTLTYAATGLPPGLSISSSGLVSGTPTTAGTYAVTATATDSTGASGSASFTWTVNPGTTGGGCKVSYATASEWPGGFVANVTITNAGTTAINGWTLTWTFPGDQKISNAWSTSTSQNGKSVTATNASYNGAIAPGANVSFGFQGTWTSSDAAPTAFSVNGTACS